MGEKAENAKEDYHEEKLEDPEGYEDGFEPCCLGLLGDHYEGQEIQR